MVQATVNEPSALLAAFAAHYLELGADLVHLHLDTPHPEAEAAFKNHSKIRITRCDSAYWARVRPIGRPIAHTIRQKVNARRTFAGLTFDWLLLCDADEYLVADQDVSTMLAAQPADLDFLRVGIAEKVLPPGLDPKTIFEGTFRLPQPDGESWAAEIYGPSLATLLGRVVAGHDLGKSFLRRGGDFGLTLHWPIAKTAKDNTPSPPRDPVGAWLPDVYLAHYDALTPLSYLIKLLGKYLANQAILATDRKPGPRHAAREAQILLAVAACASRHPLAKTDMLHRLTPHSIAGLKRFGLLIDLDLAPDRLARKHFPDLNLDFSPAAFDRALRIKHADTLAKMGVT